MVIRLIHFSNYRQPNIGLLSSHSFLCHKQDACADSKNSADYIEDCGADAAGGGKLISGIIGYYKLIPYYFLIIILQWCNTVS